MVINQAASPVQTGFQSREVSRLVDFWVECVFSGIFCERPTTKEAGGRSEGGYAALLVDSTDAQDLVDMAEVLDF
jgi:hypothetical protein